MANRSVMMLLSGRGATVTENIFLQTVAPDAGDISIAMEDGSAYAASPERLAADLETIADWIDRNGVTWS